MVVRRMSLKEAPASRKRTEGRGPGAHGSGVTAYDSATGEVRWRTEGLSDALAVDVVDEHVMRKGLARAACRGETSGWEESSPCRIADLLAMSAEGRPSPWSPAVAPFGQPEESLEQATVGPVATGGANRSEVTYSDTACVCGNMTTPVLVLMAHVRRMSDL